MAFRVAISGLKAASGDLDVISNNVANSNTTGFKKSRAEFVDVFAVTDLGSSGSVPGSGVRMVDVAQQFTQGNIAFTDNNLDLSISGNGFFIVDDGGTSQYTRNGAFRLDRENYFSNSQGQRLIAFSADNAGNITGAAGPLQINRSDIAPQSTGNISLTANLDSDDALPTVGTFDRNDQDSYNHSISTTIYDSLGNDLLAEMYFVKDAANEWDMHIYVDGVDVGGGAQTVDFTNAGAIDTGATTTPFTTPSFTPVGGGAAQTLTFDISDITQYSTDYSTIALTQDGYTAGRLDSLDIDSNGIIFARYSNGQSNVEGQIAMANFPNVQGLSPISDTSWGETFASGQAIVGSPGTSNLGLIQSGALEDSNVDLSEELVNMIIAQRSFQANAEVIQTADAVTQAIINIR